MNTIRIINQVCGILGFMVIIFGITIRTGLISGIPVQKGLVLIILGVVIVLWAIIMRRRYR